MNKNVESSPEKKTQAQTIYEALRRQILTCELRPGLKVKINELAERFEGSSGSVREALSRLSADNLVASVAQKGYVVKPVSVEELADLTDARLDLERECLARSIRFGDAKWEGQLLSVAHQLKRTPLSGYTSENADDETYFRVHSDFHLALVSACRSPWRLRLRNVLYEHTQRYWHYSGGPVVGSRDVHGEHDALVEAALSHDTTLALRLLTEHLQQTSQIVLKLTDALANQANVSSREEDAADV